MTGYPSLYNKTFFSMALANFCTLTSFGFFFMFPLFVLDRGGNQSDVGIVMGAFALASVLCRPWISQMVDRLGRKRCYTFGLTAMSLSPLAYLTFSGDLRQFYFFLILVRIGHGVGFAVCITAAFTYVADIIPKGRLNEGIGIFGVSGLAGAAFGPAVAELIIRHGNFRALFVTAAAIALLGLLAHLPVPESYVRCSRERGPSFFQLLRSTRVGTVAVLAALFGFGLAASNSFVSPFASMQGLAFISVYYVAYSFAAVMTRFLGVRLADRLGEDRVIPYAIFITGAGLLSLIPVSGSGQLAASGFMTGLGHGFLYPCLNALALRGEPIEVRGKITGVYTGSIDAGAFGGSVILGYIGEWAGFQALFLTAGAVLLMALGVFWFQRKQLHGGSL